MDQKQGYPPENSMPTEPPPAYTTAYSQNVGGASTGGMVNAGYTPPQYPQQQYGFQAQQYGMSQQQATVIVAQPRMQYTAVHTNTADNMGLAIFATICCCWPIGIVAIMRASEARSACARGDVTNAQILSNQSKRLSFWAIACGAISVVVIIIAAVSYVVTYNNENWDCWDC